MKNNTEKVMKVVQIISFIMMFISITYFIWGETYKKEVVNYNVDPGYPYNNGWEMVQADGSKTPITLPGSFDVPAGETMVIEKVLPGDLEETWICIRSSQQDIKIYVDDVILTEYSTVETRFFGKNSVSTYVFAQLDDEYAGKTLRMELLTHSVYSGRVNEIISGDRAEIWSSIVRAYFPVTLLSLFMLLLSIMVVVYCVVINFI